MYDPLFRGFSEKTGEGVFVFGPRIARAVIIHALTAGEESVRMGLPFSYRELKSTWREALVDATLGINKHCGLKVLLGRIEVEKSRVGSNPEFDEASKIAERLNHGVFQEMMVLVLVNRKPVVREEYLRPVWSKVG